MQKVEPRYVTEREVSSITGFAVQTLRNDRSRVRGIPYTKRGRAVRYFLPDVYAYMQARRVKIDEPV